MVRAGGRGISPLVAKLQPVPLSKALPAAVLIFFVACGDLSGVGGRSSDWIREPTLETTATSAPAGPTLASVSRIEWFNNDLAPVGGTTSAEIIAGVFTRANASDPFVQATPSEIAVALPGVEFPSQIPLEVRFITSQLVYDLSRLTLAADQVAAFGLWSVEPYTRSRSVGQQGVFTVAHDAEGLAAIASGTADTSCARYIDRQAQCAVSDVGGRPAWELTDNLGVTLIWYSDTYRYELFLRAGVNAGLAKDIAESSRLLINLAT